MAKGDLVHDVYLSCGHKDTVTQRDAAHRPAWMISCPEVGAKAICPFCKKNITVVTVKLVQGWAD